MVDDTARQLLPTATGFAARQAIADLRKRNIAAGHLLERVGLSARDLDDRRHHVSSAAQSTFLEYAAETSGDSAFGLHLAEQANPREAGLLFYVASAGKNVAEALVLFERYFRVVNEAVRLKLVKAAGNVAVEVNFIGLSRPRVRQNVEFGIAVILKALRETAGRRIRPIRVTFAHARNSYLREFERFYGSPVEFAAPKDQMTFSRDILDLPLITGDPYLLETLQPFCDHAAKERNTAAESVRALVENEVQRLLPHGKAEKQTVAKALGMSERTLSRRLEDEDATYEKVVDQLRRSLARQYIREPGISVSQIAWLLGYEGATSFNHAFRRWTGCSPSAARGEKELPAPV